ncbi:MAG: efflux RND transporter periplasmic adaptor subunit [Nitrospiraceae bacterium]
MILWGVGGILLFGLAFIVLQEQHLTVAKPGASGQAGEAADSATGVVPVQVMKPQRRDIAATITLPANISPWYQATLYAKVPGYLTWMGFDKGDSVKKGELLAVIDAPEVEQQYRQAEADYAIKRITYERLHNVWKENPDVIAKQDVDVAEAAAEASKHLMDNRRAMLGYTKVYAPFSGVITARFADPGALIQSAATSATQAVPLYTIMDLDTVRVYVSVPQELALLAKPGVPTVLTFKELRGKEFKGSITRTTEALDPATRTLLVEIDMPNKERDLHPGMYVSATLYLREHPNALVVPPAAIETGGSNGGKSVFLVEQGKARQVPIETDIDDGVWVEVVEGLTGNEDIVVVGKASLTDGQAVKASTYNLPEGKPSSQKY